MNLTKLDHLTNDTDAQRTVADAIAEQDLEVVGGPTDDSFDHEFGTEKVTGFDIEECADVTVAVGIADLDTPPLFVAVRHENAGVDTDRMPRRFQNDPTFAPWEATIIMRLKSCSFVADMTGNPKTVDLTYEFSGFYRQEG